MCAPRKRNELARPALIRSATTDDIARLLAIEHSRSGQLHGNKQRHFRHLLGVANALTLVDEKDGALRGYITLLFRTKLSVARIHSIATRADLVGQGVASGLLMASEQAALDHDCARLRLEVDRDNLAALRLFRGRGYLVGEHHAGIDGGIEVLRLEKALTRYLRPDLAGAPYYRQTLGFTCGASCLMMAMKAFEPSLELDRTLELQLWREATTIFMTSGHGGCGPHGLALAARRRGFPCAIYESGKGVLFQESVRSQDKRDVIALVQEDFSKQAAELQIPHHRRLGGAATLLKCFGKGGIPIVLISCYRLTRERAPHWVVITGFDEHFVYLHDPDNASARGSEERINLAILKADFDRMARYGRRGNRAAVVIYPPAFSAG